MSALVLLEDKLAPSNFGNAGRHNHYNRYNRHERAYLAIYLTLPGDLGSSFTNQSECSIDFDPHGLSALHANTVEMLIKAIRYRSFVESEEMGRHARVSGTTFARIVNSTKLTPEGGVHWSKEESYMNYGRFSAMVTGVILGVGTCSDSSVPLIGNRTIIRVPLPMVLSAVIDPPNAVMSA